MAETSHTFNVNGVDSEFEQADIAQIVLYKNDIIGAKLPILYSDSEGIVNELPSEDLTEYLSRRDRATPPLYMLKGWLSIIGEYRKKHGAKAIDWEASGIKNPDAIGARTLQSEKEYLQTVERVETMTPEERAEALGRHCIEIDKIANRKGALDETEAKSIIEASTSARLISKITYTEALRALDETKMDEPGAKTMTREVGENTARAIDSIIRALSERQKTQEIFEQIKATPHGVTYSHSNRVFVTLIEFLFFYNEALNAGLGSKLRALFKRGYVSYYERLLPGKKIEKIEDIIEKGLAPVPTRKIGVYALGALLHDIGKAEHLDYFEGDDGPNPELIRRHVYRGFSMILRTSEHPREVALMAAFHHEYYGHPSGYGLFRDYIRALPKEKVERKFNYALSYDYKSVERFSAFAFFPVKALEILDIYDALTAPTRKYNAWQKPKEAIEFMRREFVENALKIDPILFDAFVDFLGEKRSDITSACRLVAMNAH